MWSRSGKKFGRRAAIGSVLSAAAGLRGAWAAPRAAIRIGTLRFGAVSWELDVIRRHGLDTAADIAFTATQLPTTQAMEIALQAGAVDMVAVDWLWVCRQRAEGADWTFVSCSNAVGAVIVPKDSPLEDIRSLRGHKLGIAGSPLDKSWLILRAFAQLRYGVDLEASVDKSFAVPPLLAEEMRRGRLDAVLTYWPYAAKAEALGMRRLLGVSEAVSGLGISAQTPVLGYVFSAAWAANRRAEVERFFAAARNARAILASSDAEWHELAPLTGAANADELGRLTSWYRTGIPREWTEAQGQAAAELYKVLAEIGGPSLIGRAASVTRGTFWNAATL